MIKKLFKLSGWVALIPALLATAYFALFTFSIKAESTGFPPADFTLAPELSGEDTAFGGIFMMPFFNDSLPHYIYKQKEDSVQQIRFRLEDQNKNFPTTGTGLGNIGVATIEGPPKNAKPDTTLTHMFNVMMATADSIFQQGNPDDALTKQLVKEKQDSIKKEMNRYRDSVKTVSHYLSLRGYTTDHLVKFYVAKDQYFLAVWQSDQYVRVPISVRYAADSKEVLIPISKGQYNAAYVFITIFPLVLAFVMVYVLIGLPIQLLINISKGKAFIEKNIRILRVMSIVLFVVTVFGIISPYLFHLLFSNQIPSQITLEQSFGKAVFNQLTPLFISVSLFIVSLAFKKGYKLQQEQDLTV